MKNLDEKDCKILNMLQMDCRASLTNIAKEVDLSVDSVKKRINGLIRNNIFYSKIQLRPRHFGYSNVVDVKIKLQNNTEEKVSEFIDYLVENPRVVEIFQIAGEWDLSIVIISKDALDLGKTTSQIRDKFGYLINSWNESLTLDCFKFEKYDMFKLYENRDG
tara:strand:- start:584 stop:1069 length:486 start_codon:yes stop_codon:yes gene_type:complete